MIGQYSPLPYERWRWWVGIPRDFWMVNVGFIGDFIKKNNLKPVEPEVLMGDDPVPVGLPEPNRPATAVFRPRPFPGGMKAAHLHFRGDLYRVTSEQWADFSKNVVRTFTDKLKNAGAVSFDKVIELSDAIDTIG